MMHIAVWAQRDPFASHLGVRAGLRRVERVSLQVELSRNGRCSSARGSTASIGSSDFLGRRRAPCLRARRAPISAGTQSAATIENAQRRADHVIGLARGAASSPPTSARDRADRKTPAARQEIEAEIAQQRADRADHAEHADRGHEHVAVKAPEREQGAGAASQTMRCSDAAIAALSPPNHGR